MRSAVRPSVLLPDRDHVVRICRVDVQPGLFLRVNVESLARSWGYAGAERALSERTGPEILVRGATVSGLAAAPCTVAKPRMSARLLIRAGLAIGCIPVPPPVPCPLQGDALPARPI